MRSAASLLALAVACSAPTPVFSGPGFDTDPPRPGPLNGLIVTSGNGDDTLTAVDPVAAVKRFTIPLGFIPVELEGPHHAAADPLGRWVFVNLNEAVAGSGSGPHGSHGTGTIPGFLLRMRTSDGAIDAWVQVETNPGELTVSPDGSTAYVSHYDLLAWLKGAQAGDLRQGDSNIVAVDTATMQVKARMPVCPAAHGVRASADGRRLFVACGPDELGIIDLGAPPTARRVALGGAVEGGSCEHCPDGLSVAPDGAVWVSTLGPDSGREGGGAVYRYDPGSDTFLDAAPLSYCGRAVFTAFHVHAGGYTAYVPEQGPCGDSVHVYEVQDHALTAGPVITLTPKDCQNANMLFVAADGLTASLICEGDHTGPGSFVKLDLTGQAPPVSLPVGVFSDGGAFVPPAR